jgi:hypothetical protein
MKSNLPIFVPNRNLFSSCLTYIPDDSPTMLLVLLKDDCGNSVAQALMVSSGVLLVVGMTLFTKTAIRTVNQVMAEIAKPQDSDGTNREMFPYSPINRVNNSFAGNFLNPFDNRPPIANPTPVPSPQPTPFLPRPNPINSQLFAPQVAPAMPLGPTLPIPVSPILSGAVDRISAAASTKPRLIDGRVVRNSDGDVVPVYPGHCSRAVFQQLIDAKVVTKGVEGRLRPAYAKDAGLHLEANGFTRLSDYDPRKPLKGDIAVVPPFPGDTSDDGKGSGHISIYDGTQWVSDAKQGRHTFNPYRNKGVSDRQVAFYRHGWGTPSLD